MIERRELRDDRYNKQQISTASVGRRSTGLATDFRAFSVATSATTPLVQKNPNNRGLLIDGRAMRRSGMRRVNIDLLAPLLGIHTHDDQPKQNNQFSPEKVDREADWKACIEEINQAIS